MIPPASPRKEKWSARSGMLLAFMLSVVGCASVSTKMTPLFHNYLLDDAAPVDASLQLQLEKIYASLRDKFGLTSAQAAVGLLDLTTLRLAMIHPDREEYAASVPKIGILLAYFQLRPEAATNLPDVARREL